MKRLLLTLISVASLAAASLAQPLALYENFGTVTDNAPIDATAFANYGVFSVFSALPFDFQNTLYFTNRGTMTSTPGFRFAQSVPKNAASGIPFRSASNFVNEVGGIIAAGDVAGIIVSANGGGGIGSFSGQILSPSYLLLSADTIINKGIMLAGGAGLLQLNGKNVDVSRSGLGIGRLELSPTHFVSDTNYFPDPGIYDNYWALTNQFDMRVANLLQTSRTATNVTSPRHDVTNSAAAFFPISAQLRLSITNTNGFVSVYTNTGGADPDTGRFTNIYRQAAFVAVNDTNFAIDVKWSPSNIATNPYQTAVVELRMRETNIITGDLEFSTLYLKDMLASWTNYNVLANISANPTTFIPATFELTRTPPIEFITGSPPKGGLTNTFFYDSKDTNFVAIVTNLYAGYAANIDSLASRPPNAPGLQVTDNPGRIEINADTLDLTRARLRGTGLISLKATNLLSTKSVVVDSENVIYDLAAPNGAITFNGVAKERVVRLNGPLYAWSAVWTNYFGIKATNQVDDGTGTLTNVVTNLVTEVDYHMLIVDATGLQATKPVITHDFIVHANDVTLSDPVTLVRKLLIDSDTFTLNNRLTLTGTIENWAATNAPRLKAFTSKGVFTVPNIANFGQDRATGYETFNNSGFISANGLLFKSTTFLNSGNLTSLVDGIGIEAQTAQFENATTMSAGDLNIKATDLRFTASTNLARGRLVLNASHSLADSGEGANNIFGTTAGFHLLAKPTLGDLLGTTILSVAPRYARVEHSWAGEDRGPSAAGFENNVAIGHLVLGGDRDVLLSFHGATGANGMYVDLLELTGPLTNALAAEDLGSALEVDPSLTIYFANSNVPADQLEQQSGGRLRHVEFAGPADFVDVPVRSGGESVQMARTDRQSAAMDSDGDGIANRYDSFPLDFDKPIQVVAAATQAGISLSWEAQPNTTYQVEYSSSLGSPIWQLLYVFANADSAAHTATAQDQLGQDHAQRFYRVRSSQ